MSETSNFKIYDASAGSGKTFNLVKEYLVKVFSSKSKLAYSQILALTFTNKAVGEMKERILNMLKDFSDQEILNAPTDMFKMLQKDLDLTAEQLHKKSYSLLRTILHNYAAFDVSTIDKFNHRLIRTFSSDLKLPANFNVELDVDYVLSKAVDNLIAKAGEDEYITNLLMAFSKQKIDEDRSWDVSYDLNKIAVILKNDDDKLYVEAISEKSLEDFKNLEANLKDKIKIIEKLLVNKALTITNKLEEHNLMEGVFSYNTLPNHFIKIANLNLGSLYNNKLQQNLENGTSLYKKSTDKELASIIDNLLPELLNVYMELKVKVHELLFLKNALHHLTPLSVIHEINKCLQDILAEEGIVLISDFNSIIHNEIKQQPAPYIYERLGERYKDYFVDEFQDTSVMQWINMVPLLDNALSQETLSGKRGSAMLVGDAKQAIYRWRGGKPEQFMNLYNGSSNPFSLTPETINLESNYRSKKTIVEFNNGFFDFISNRVFSTELHTDLFLRSGQLSNSEEEGYVKFQFVEEDDDEDVDDAFAELTLQSIREAKEDGYNLDDICILTRANKEGAKIANFLSESNIPIISSESLLLSSSDEVNFIISTLRTLQNPGDLESKLDVLEYLYKASANEIDSHTFYLKNLAEDNNKFYSALEKYGFHFNPARADSMPLYEVMEYIVRMFLADKESDAYIQFLLDEVYNFSQRSNLGLKEFVEHWENKKDKLAVSSPEGLEAVKIMSIHKSKGLEFPVVIFPYASHKIYDDRGAKMWFPVEVEEFSGFEHLYISINKELKEFSERGEFYYDQHRSYLELDSINRLYVTLTRAIDRLYIFSKKDLPKKKGDGYSKFSELFVDYLKSQDLYEEGKTDFEIGKRHKPKIKVEAAATLESIKLISTPREQLNLSILTNQGRLWDTDRKDALERGNLLHHVLSFIDYKTNVNQVFKILLENGEISREQEASLLLDVIKIIDHPMLSIYFTEDWEAINERELITASGELHRPDRIVINAGKEAVVIDYKTGSKEKKHRTQLNLYANLLTQMGYSIKSKFLVYVGFEVEILEI